MKFTLISQNEFFTISNRVLKYPTHIAEKDYLLTLALKTIYNSKLKTRLVFKGGTALHHYYLPQYRFSEDLDFTSIDQNVKTEDVKAVFKNHPNFTIKKTFSSEITFKIEKLQYTGILAQPGSLKIDISNVKNIVLPAQKLPHKNAWKINVDTVVMDILEICAEKISATNGRVRYRDFYDLYLITHELEVDVNNAIELLASKNIEKPIKASNIVKNWVLAQKDKSNDLNTIYLKKAISDEEIGNFVKRLNFKNIEIVTSPQSNP